MRAELFDMDDTLLAFDMVAEQSWQNVCRAFASRIGGLDANLLYDTIAAVRIWYMSDKERHRYSRLNLVAYRREMVAMALSRLGVNDTDLADAIAAAYGVEREDAMFVIPGALDLLASLKSTGVRLALLTNGEGSMQRRKIDRFGLAPFFDCILIEGELGFGKPDSRVFLTALEKVSGSAADSWMIGDDLERDIGGAQSSGIRGVWVDWQGNGLPPSAGVRPDRVVGSVAGLTPSGLWES